MKATELLSTCHYSNPDCLSLPLLYEKGNKSLRSQAMCFYSVVLKRGLNKLILWIPKLQWSLYQNKWLNPNID